MKMRSVWTVEGMRGAGWMGAAARGSWRVAAVTRTFPRRRYRAMYWMQLRATHISLWQGFALMHAASFRFYGLITVSLC